MACALLQRLSPRPQMTGCEVRIAERHLDGGMARQGRDFREGCPACTKPLMRVWNLNLDYREAACDV